MPFDFSTLDFSTFDLARIDELLYAMLVWFGWIPITMTLLWGFAQMWQNYRQGVYGSKLQHILLSISVPSATEQSPKAVENLFSNLYGAKSSLLWKEIWIEGKYNASFSFEIASNEGRVGFFVRTQPKFRDLIEAGIYAQYPEAEIYEVEDYAAFVTPEQIPEDYQAWGSELVLKKEPYLPIRTYVEYEDRLSQELKDPLGQILELLGRMTPGEYFWVQFVIQPAENDWKDAGIKFIKKSYGIEEKAAPGLLSSALASTLSIPNMAIEELTGISLMGEEEAMKDDPFKGLKIPPDVKEQAEAVLMKVSKTGYNVKTRVVYLARSDVFQKPARTGIVKGMLHQYAHLNLNSFGMYGPVTPKDDYFWQRWGYEGKMKSLVSAYKSRSFGLGANPSILNTEELATLWHFPQIGVKAPLVEKALARRAEPPTDLPFTIGGGELPTGPSGPLPGAESAPPVPPELPGLADIPFEEPPPPQVPDVERPTRAAAREETSVPPNLPL